MNKNWFVSVFSSFVVFALTMPIAGSVAAGQIDTENGVILYDGPPLVGEQISCTLGVVPDVLQNGQTFQFQVNYSPYIAGTWQENFVFYWPSKTTVFDELTIRQKSFVGQGPVDGSRESAITPTATNIAGTGLALVTVSGPTGPVCSAFKLFTVQNL